MTTTTNAASSEQLLFEHLSHAKVPSLRLFCFPYAGGSADVYRGWQRWFTQEVDICLVHLPGRGKRIGEHPFTRLLPLVKAVADWLPLRPDVPYALYGHSMGALISFELGRELFQRRGAGPEHLFVSGRRAPHLPANEPITFNLPYDQLIAELKRLNGTPREILDNPELMELFQGPLRADFEVVETYEYRSAEPLSCPITVYSGIQDEHVPLESCQAWQRQSTGACTVRVFDGDHFFIRHPQALFISAFRDDVLSAVPFSRKTHL